MSLTLKDIEGEACRRSGAFVKVVPDGPQARLVHPHGPSVLFGLKRSDLELPLAQFGERVLAPAIAALNRLLAPEREPNPR